MKLSKSQIEAINKAKENKRKMAERFSENEPVVCKWFGCGKKLTPTEYMFSDYCFKHQRDIKNENNSI